MANRTKDKKNLFAKEKGSALELVSSIVRIRGK
jgi:hypothetical protein